MTKVYIEPHYKDKPDAAHGGIRRVSEAMIRHLPTFGVEVVYEAKDADVLMNHGAALVDIPGIPSINLNHGLYWSRYEWGDNYQDVNRMVVESMRRSVAHTAPSEWVSTAMRRGMLIDPEVVYHGVDAEDWDNTKEKQPFVLWNKARTDMVSNPGDMDAVARLIPNTKFISTFGNKSPNVKIVGAMPYGEMKSLIEESGVYLSTARETFGIGTLEAMASGVPVVGWDWGGNNEIVISGETGILVPYGDYDALASAITRCLAERHRMGEAARQDVIERWGWERRILQYATIAKRVQKIYASPRPKVSIIVTSFNLGRYLKDCLKSVQTQSLEDFECLIVDDCSTDNTKAVAKEFLSDKRFKYIKTPYNLKLSMARNYGISKSTGRYLIMLDADDMFDRTALEILSGELDKDWGIHIAYGHLDTFTDEAPKRKRNSWPFDQFNWAAQMAHLNQLPYSALVRREVYERSGGYRERHWRAEDSNFWCRVTSMGFRAVKVTQASTLIYRMRNDSKSNGEDGDGDWTSWYPWRIAGEPREGLKRINSGANADPGKTPFGAQGKPPNGHAWPVRDCQEPFVSVIIPVGPDHEKYAIDAIESVFAQTYQDWEVIVVNDTGESWEEGFLSPISGAPYARVIETEGSTGAGAARNLGASIARGKALVWLDADDYLTPQCLDKMVMVAGEVGPAVIYTDWIKMDHTREQKPEYAKSKDFICGHVLIKMQHSNNIMVPKSYHDKIGGYDPTVPGWEDWYYQIELQLAGLCSYRIPEALFVYNFYTGKRRDASKGMEKKLIAFKNAKYANYTKGDFEMACGGCAKGRGSQRRPIISTINENRSTDVSLSSGSVKLNYMGANVPLSLRSPNYTGVIYRFTSSGRIKSIPSLDAEQFLNKMINGKPMFVKLEDQQEQPAATPEAFLGQDIVK